MSQGSQMSNRRRIAAAAAVLGLSIGGCGDESSSGDKTERADVPPKRTAQPRDTSKLPITRNTDPSENDLARLRDTKVQLADCVRADGARAATDPAAVRSVVIGRARGLMLRITWEDGGGADAYFGSTPANVQRTRASLPKAAHVYRNGSTLVLGDRQIDPVQRKLLDRCLAPR